MRGDTLLLIGCLFTGVVIWMPNSQASGAFVALPRTPEQEAIVEADYAIPADQPSLRIDINAVTSDGKPNPSFGRPFPLFVTRHQQFLDRRSQPMNVLFIGDSITQGWENEGASVWKVLFEPLQAANFGVSGDRTQHVLWRIEHGELDGVSPCVVVLLIGTNNSGKNTPEEIAAGISKILKLIKEKIPGTRIVLLNLLPRSFKPMDSKGQPDLRRRVLGQTNEILSRMDNGKDIFYLPLWEPFLDENGVLKQKLMPDAVHPNKAGYEIMGRAIKEKLDKIERSFSETH